MYASKPCRSWGEESLAGTTGCANGFSAGDTEKHLETLLSPLANVEAPARDVRDQPDWMGFPDPGLGFSPGQRPAGTVVLAAANWPLPRRKAAGNAIGSPDGWVPGPTGEIGVAAPPSQNRPQTARERHCMGQSRTQPGDVCQSPMLSAATTSRARGSTLGLGGHAVPALQSGHTPSSRPAHRTLDTLCFFSLECSNPK